MRITTLVRKNLTRRKLATFLVLLSITVAFLIFGILRAFQLAADSGGSGTSTGRLLVSNEISFTQPLPIGYLGRISATPGVGRVTHRTWFGGYYREPQNFIVTYAVDPDTYFELFPETGADAGAIARFRSQPDALLVGTAVAQRFGIKAGDRTSLFSNVYSRRDGGRSWDFEVAGLMPSAASQFQNTALMHYRYLDEARSFSDGTVSQFVVLPRDSRGIDLLIAAIDRKFENSLAETSTMTEAMFNRAFMAQFANVSLIVLLVTGAAFASILMIVGSTIVRAVRERRRETAVQLALGFTRAQIGMQIVGETLFLSAGGGMLGMLLASLLLAGARATAQGQLDHIVLAPSIWGTAALIMLLFGLVTAVIPLLVVAKMDVGAVLRRS
jgi:putative ABC transport system permease protein